MHWSSEWRISIGSSIVTMCCVRVRLISPIIAASVVGRHRERVEGRHRLRDHAESERDRSALAERVDSETRQVERLVGHVEVARVVEELKACGRGLADEL